MPVSAPTIKLSSGHNIPVLGLGTFMAGRQGAVKESVITAIEAGYRHIDCAHVYENEKEVGAGIKEKIDDGTVKREDLFVTSKLWNNAHHPDYVVPAIKQSLQDLGLAYLDLYLIHWPMGVQPGNELFPRHTDGSLIMDNETDLVDTWKQMEELVRLGLTKSIGLSNFNSEQVERILKNSTIPPAVNQIEIHAYLPQHKLVEFCQKRGIAVTAYSPFSTPSPAAIKSGELTLLTEPKVLKIAEKYGKGANHVLVKWLLQRGLITIPKSFTKSRIIDNFDVFDFKLTADDMKEIESLDKGTKGRCFTEEWLKDSKDYPLNIEF